MKNFLQTVKQFRLTFFSTFSSKTKIKVAQKPKPHLNFWLRGQDLILRPSGYEPDELPNCSTPRPSEGRIIQTTRRGVKAYLRFFSFHQPIN